MVVQLAGVAYYGYVGLYHRIHVLRVVPIRLKQPDAEGGMIDFAFLSFQVVPELSK